MAHVLIGSTVNALARTSPVQLLVVKKRVLETQGRAAVATDRSDSSKPALMVGLRWFGFRRLELFHAFDPPYRGLVDDKAAYDAQFEESAVEKCRAFVQGVAGADAVSMIEVIVRHGDPVTGLEVLTNEADTDLVIAGMHGRSGLMHALFGLRSLAHSE